MRELAELVGDLLAKDLACRGGRRLVAGGEDDQVGFDRAAVVKGDPGLGEARDAAVAELDAAVDDELGCAGVVLVAGGVLPEDQSEDARPIRAVAKFETGGT